MRKALNQSEPMYTLYWFMFFAHPQPANPDYFRVPAAFVNAWVAHSDPVIAEHIARDAIQKELWEIERLEQWSVVSRTTYKDSLRSLEHFEEALLKGHCLAFIRWPSEENINHQRRE